MITEALHLFIQRSRLHQAGTWIIGACACHYGKKTELFWINGSVCEICTVCRFFSDYSGVVSPCLMTCVCLVRTVSALLCALLCAFMCLLAVGVSRCFMWACVCVYVCVHKCVYDSVWVFIGSQWVKQSSWPHFLLLLTETFSPKAPETRHCLEELSVTTAYNHLICHCFDCFIFWQPSKLCFSLSGPWGQDLTVRESPRHERLPDNFNFVVHHRAWT